MGAARRSAVDPDGRLVVFDAGSHLHLALGGRARLLEQVDAILAAVRAPDHRSDDPRPGRERFYRRNPVYPDRWLRVVVDFEASPAWVVTAVVQTNDPRRSRG